MHSDISSIDHPYSINTSDHYVIHGLLNLPQNVQITDLQSKIVILPTLQDAGLHSHLLQTQRKFFNQNGFDVLRVSFSSLNQDGRNFQDITLGHMANDIRQICTDLRASYDNIFIAAHGLCSFAAALSNADCEGLSLIEPCFVPYENFVESGYAYRRDLNMYQSLLNPMECLSPRLVESCKLFDHASCRGMIQSMDKPSQLIWAEGGLGENMAALYKAHLNTHAQSVTIAGADHNFNAANSMEKALEQSLEWINYCNHMYVISALTPAIDAYKLPTYAVN